MDRAEKLYKIMDDSQKSKETETVAEEGAFGYKPVVPKHLGLRSSVNQSFVIDAVDASKNEQI